MTELETMQRAKRYMDKLARGIDPISNQEVLEDSVLNNVQLVRCFLYVSEILEQVIANGGVVGSKQKLLPFSVTPEQLACVRISQKPIRITQLVGMLNAVVDNPQIKKLQTTVITDWLLEKGFMEKQTGPDGKSIRIPTKNGALIGLFCQIQQGQHGEYRAVYYNADAQQFVLDNLTAMLSGK